jgi:hypothetical protein
MASVPPSKATASIAAVTTKTRGPYIKSEECKKILTAYQTVRPSCENDLELWQRVKAYMHADNHFPKRHESDYKDKIRSTVEAYRVRPLQKIHQKTTNF